MNHLPEMLKQSILYQQYGDDLRRLGKRQGRGWYGLLFFSVATSLVLWGIWAGLEALARFNDDRKKAAQKLQPSQGKVIVSDDIVVPKFSPMVVNLLLETDIMPYLVIDVRPAADSAMHRLPPAMRKHSVNLPISSLAPALNSSKVWQDMFPFVAYPVHHHILLFVGTTENMMKYGAALAIGLDFQRVAILEGSIQQYAECTIGNQGIKKLNRDVLSILIDILQKTWPDFHEGKEEEANVPETGHSEADKLSLLSCDQGLERADSFSPQNSRYSGRNPWQ